MEQERDYIDKVLISEAEVVSEKILTEGRFGEGYNSRLLEKLKDEKLLLEKRNSGKVRTAAISLITAGILMAFMYTSNVQYGITNLQCKIKYDYTIIMHNINFGNFF
jgi:hypothetical protein